MKVTEMFKRKNGQLLCDHDMSYKLDPIFMKWISYMESRKRFGMPNGIPFSISMDAYDSTVDGKWAREDHEVGLDGKLVLNDI